MKCPTCKGTGDLNLNKHERVWDKCPDCDGSGEALPESHKCPVCGDPEFRCHHDEP